MTAQTINNVFPTVEGDKYKTSSSVKAVNLLYEYNQKFTKQLTAKQALTDIDFLKYASITINSYVDRIQKLSTLFNIGAKERFTPKEDLNLLLLSDFSNSVKSYLYADTKNTEFVTLPQAENVPYWQGSGNSYNFDDISKIDINIKDKQTTKNIVLTGLVGVLFDKNAVGVCNQNRRVTTYYNAKGEFYNNFYKFDCSYFNDLNENYVVFFINDKTSGA